MYCQNLVENGKIAKKNLVENGKLIDFSLGLHYLFIK